MLDLAGDQASAAQRAGAAHREAGRLHLDAHRTWQGRACGRRLLGTEPATEERAGRVRASSAGVLAGWCTSVWAEGQRCYGAEESGGESEGAVSQRSSKCLETPVLVLPLPAVSRGFIRFPRTLPPNPTGRSHWDLETRPEPGARPIHLEKELWAPLPGGSHCGVCWRRCKRLRGLRG